MEMFDRLVESISMGTWLGIYLLWMGVSEEEKLKYL